MKLILVLAIAVAGAAIFVREWRRQRDILGPCNWREDADGVTFA